MNEHNMLKEEALYIMREVEEDPTLNQRLLSQRLNISLGKTNYMLKELAKKGIIKIANFSKNSEKTKKIKYILTKKGMEEKAILTLHFLKAKEKEYKRLKEDYAKHMGNARRSEKARIAII